MMTTKRTNEEWLADLREAGPAQETALADLHAIILSGLPYALSKWLSPDNPLFTPLAEEVAQETLLRVLANMDSFEGRSQFTTWVHKIAVRVALTELRRKRWKDISLDNLMENEESPASPSLMADPAIGPERAVEQEDMLALVQRLIAEELTEKQRQAMIAVTIQGVPLEEVARRMGMQRNALYKLMHDARLRLKRRMASEGLSPQDVLAVFESE
ncbi:MAG: RNA polymerase sigma factor [Anaerolineales bacterium]|nr:RNA polymerase sigma factor [Anaerolineales bacterium]MCK5428641.1 RNA polymerase sigma factor [Anaerolineales bacterium]